jgi:hypothetical protein
MTAGAKLRSAATRVAGRLFVALARPAVIVERATGELLQYEKTRQES